MAERRMISKAVISSARFLKMPIDSQALYFHLSINADDDGIVEGFSIIRQIGSNEDNLRVLAAKNFVRILNEDLVSYITDWTEHNYIRADRKRNSIHQSLLLKVLPDAEIIEPKPRADTGKPTGRKMDSEWTANGLRRLGKDSIGKDREGKDKETTKFIKPSVGDIKEYCKERKNTINAEQFFDYYESKGWMIGKNKMKDWKAAVRTWERNDNKIVKDHLKTL